MGEMKWECAVCDAASGRKIMPHGWIMAKNPDYTVCSVLCCEQLFKELRLEQEAEYRKEDLVCTS